MAGPWSSGFSRGFGPLGAEQFPTSPRNADVMMTLAFTSTETLLYDNAESQDFYVLVKPPEIAQTTLFWVSPLFASQWFALNQSSGIRTIYNPFASNLSRLSNVI